MEDELVEIWLRGYCRSRTMPSPEVVPEGFWIEVAKPQQAGRFILSRFDPVAISRLTGKIVEPSVYVEFPGSKAYALPLLPEGWAIRDDSYLMKRLLSKRGVRAEVDGYILIEEEDEAGLTVTARSEAGELAARGCYAAFGRHAIFDQIATEPAHQRRGLASAIMARLSDHAAHRSLIGGLLVATEEGRGFYLALGWIELSPIISMISGSYRNEAR